MQTDLTRGKVSSSLLLFSLPMIAGNLLQQFYNVADTIIVGKYISSAALAAVGSSFALMVFLTSVILGLCMGSGIAFSIFFGARSSHSLKSAIFTSFIFIASVTLFINVLVFWQIDNIMILLDIPHDIYDDTRLYLYIIFYGIGFTFLYNYFASLLRALGNSTIPLWFLGVAAILNVILDLVFILIFDMGIGGAAWATVIAQAVSALGIMIYCMNKLNILRFSKHHLQFHKAIFYMRLSFSLLTCVQQSVMNFGILLVQRLINGFGTIVMAAFAAAVKIDAFAYMPVQDFGNAFSTFIAQNFGAKKRERIREGIWAAIKYAFIFCLIISIGVFVFAEPLMLIFIKPEEKEVIRIGVEYLQIEGACYFGIGCLFLLYGLYRGLGRPAMSVVLTVVSLGTRVVLAYWWAFIPSIGLIGVWWSIPIGWFLADAIGIGYYVYLQKKRSI